jgi:hypothetical protein
MQLVNLVVDTVDVVVVVAVEVDGTDAIVVAAVVVVPFNVTNCLKPVTPFISKFKLKHSKTIY